MQFDNVVFIGNPRCCCTSTAEYWNHNRKDYHEYFTDETLEIVNEYLKKDIEFLDYEY